MKKIMVAFIAIAMLCGFAMADELTQEQEWVRDFDKARETRDLAEFERLYNEADKDHYVHEGSLGQLVRFDEGDKWIDETMERLPELTRNSVVWALIPLSTRGRHADAHAVALKVFEIQRMPLGRATVALTYVDYDITAEAEVIGKVLDCVATRKAEANFLPTLKDGQLVGDSWVTLASNLITEKADELSTPDYRRLTGRLDGMVSIGTEAGRVFLQSWRSVIKAELERREMYDIK